MSEVGYYRYKTTADVQKDVTFGKNGVLSGTKTVIPFDSCSEDIRIKYLDKNGQYRYYAFNRYYRTSDAPEKIGSVTKFITNIQSDQSESQNIGYRNKRKIEISQDVPVLHLEKLIDLYSSPRVYYYIGSNNSDTPADWLEVEIEVLDPIVRPRKKAVARVDITMTLPNNYCVTML